MFLICLITLRVLNPRFSGFPRVPGGFRELREACRNHFHLSWYLFDDVETSYGPKNWGGDLLIVLGLVFLTFGFGCRILQLLTSDSAPACRDLPCVIF